MIMLYDVGECKHVHFCELCGLVHPHAMHSRHLQSKQEMHLLCSVKALWGFGIEEVRCLGLKVLLLWGPHLRCIWC